MPATAIVARRRGGGAAELPPAALAWASDWGAAIGNTANAVTDGGKWASATLGSGHFNIDFPVADRVSVVSAPGLDFPAGMDNVLAIRYEQEAGYNSCGVRVEDGWALPATDASIYFRMYFRHDIGGDNPALNDFHHPVQSFYQAGGDTGHNIFFLNKPAAGVETFAFTLGNFSDPDPDEHHHWRVTLTRGVTYRIEQKYTRRAEDVYDFDARIYTSDNLLVFDRTNITCIKSNHGSALMSTSHSTNISLLNEAALRSRFIVNQGTLGDRGSNDADHNRIYYGGYAVSLTDWCGRYTVGEAD